MFSFEKKQTINLNKGVKWVGVGRAYQAQLIHHTIVGKVLPEQFVLEEFSERNGTLIF